MASPPSPTAARGIRGRIARGRARDVVAYASLGCGIGGRAFYHLQPRNHHRGACLWILAWHDGDSSLRADRLVFFCSPHVQLRPLLNKRSLDRYAVRRRGEHDRGLGFGSCCLSPAAGGSPVPTVSRVAAPLTKSLCGHTSHCITNVNRGADNRQRKGGICGSLTCVGAYSFHAGE